MTWSFPDVNCTIQWGESNDVKIIEIRPLRIELWCFEDLYELNSVDFAANWGARHVPHPALLAQYRDFELQRSIAQWASIEFQLFLQRWISLTSYYNLRHWSTAAYVVVINWAAGAAIAPAEFEVRRLPPRTAYR